MIEIKDISKSFNGRKVLDNVSGVFKDGETSLVIGASGTGKSVLLKCIMMADLFLRYPKKRGLISGGKWGSFSRGVHCLTLRPFMRT